MFVLCFVCTYYVFMFCTVAAFLSLVKPLGLTIRPCCQTFFALYFTCVSCLFCILAFWLQTNKPCICLRCSGVARDPISRFPHWLASSPLQHSHYRESAWWRWRGTPQSKGTGLSVRNLWGTPLWKPTSFDIRSDLNWPIWYGNTRRGAACFQETESDGERILKICQHLAKL